MGINDPESTLRGLGCSAIGKPDRGDHLAGWGKRPNEQAIEIAPSLGEGALSCKRRKQDCDCIVFHMFEHSCVAKLQSAGCGGQALAVERAGTCLFDLIGHSPTAKGDRKCPNRKCQQTLVPAAQSPR